MQKSCFKKSIDWTKPDAFKDKNRKHKLEDSNNSISEIEQDEEKTYGGYNSGNNDIDEEGVFGKRTTKKTNTNNNKKFLRILIEVDSLLKLNIRDFLQTKNTKKVLDKLEVENVALKAHILKLENSQIDNLGNDFVKLSELMDKKIERNFSLELIRVLEELIANGNVNNLCVGKKNFIDKVKIFMKYILNDLLVKDDIFCTNRIFESEKYLLQKKDLELTTKNYNTEVYTQCLTESEYTNNNEKLRFSKLKSSFLKVSKLNLFYESILQGLINLSTYDHFIVNFEETYSLKQCNQIEELNEIISKCLLLIRELKESNYQKENKIIELTKHKLSALEDNLCKMNNVENKPENLKTINNSEMAINKELELNKLLIAKQESEIINLKEGNKALKESNKALYDFVEKNNEVMITSYKKEIETLSLSINIMKDFYEDELIKRNEIIDNLSINMENILLNKESLFDTVNSCKKNPNNKELNSYFLHHKQKIINKENIEFSLPQYLDVFMNEAGCATKKLDYIKLGVNSKDDTIKIDYGCGLKSKTRGKSPIIRNFIKPFVGDNNSDIDIFDD